MGVQQYSLVSHDWVNLEQIINDLTQRIVGQELSPISSPTFADITLTGDLTITGDVNIGGDLDVDGVVTLNDLTASRIVATDASKILVSEDLVDWITGSGNITVSDDAAGGAALDTIQDIHTGASPEFDNLTLTGGLLTVPGDGSGGILAGADGVDGTLVLAAGNDDGETYGVVSLWLQGAAQNMVLSRADGEIITISPNSIESSLDSISFGDDDLTTTGTITAAGLDLTDITDGNIPYMSASGFADSPISYDGNWVTFDISTRIGLGITPEASVHIAKSGGQNFMLFDTYDDGSQFSALFFRKSDSDVVGTKAETDDGDIIGGIYYRGVDAGGDFTDGAQIRVTQKGAAGTKVPTVIDFYTSSSSSIAIGLHIDEAQNIGLGGETDPVTLIEATHTAPYITLHNSTEEDTDGGRKSRIIARGEQSGGEESILGYLEFAHDGAADDEKGQWGVWLNDGNDGTTPSLNPLRGDSSGSIYLGDGGTTNYSKFEADGTLEFNGDAVVWKDINMGPQALSIIGIILGPDTDEFVDENGDDTGIETYAFDVGEAISGSFEIQHDYLEGSDLYFHVHWQGIAAPTGTDKVQWQLTYTIAKNNTTLDAPTTITVEVDFDTQYEFLRSSFAAISGTGVEIGDQFIFSLERIAATTDEYGGDALIATVGCHYQVDTVGSRTLETK